MPENVASGKLGSRPHLRAIARGPEADVLYNRGLRTRRRFAMRSLAALAVLFCLALPSSALADGAISGGAACAGGVVTVSWSYFEDAPFGHLEWVGYDVYRRDPDPCGDLTRLNAFIIPRGIGN